MAAPVWPAGLDLTKTELKNARVHFLGTAPASPVEGQIYFDSASHVLGVYNGTSWLLLGRLDQLNAPTGDVSLNSHRLTSVADPSSAQDAATKAYVDALVQGLSWKEPVRAASTANGTLATAFENGDTMDGVTLATGDRILLKNQTTGSENGIYTVNASGAPTRATDADSQDDLLSAAVFVEEGTANADNAFVLTNDAPITVGSTSLVFNKMFGGASGSVNKTSANIGDNSSTSLTFNHALNSRDVVIEVYDNTTPYARIYPDIQHTDANNATIVFTTAPTTGQYRATAVG